MHQMASWSSWHSSSGIARITACCFAFATSVVSLLQIFCALCDHANNILSSSSTSTKTFCLSLAKYVVVRSMMTLSLGVQCRQFPLLISGRAVLPFSWFQVPLHVSVRTHHVVDHSVVDHCVAATQLTHSPPEMRSRQPPLQDWGPTLCQAQSSLIGWSMDVHILMCSTGTSPRSVAYHAVGLFVDRDVTMTKED